MSDLFPDKADWPLVKFGEVVGKVADRVDPRESGLERYVAGEHMDTDNLRLTRWGTIGEDYLGPAFHMRFQPRQVLYGSRRTYLRKVAVPDFAGITANTTFVLEPKDPTVLLADLLPFIMQTESFHEHSIRQSKGSVNPYVNFSDLAWYEFRLPPLREQRRIADVLLAAKSTSDGHLDSAELLGDLEHSVLASRLTGAPLGEATYDPRFGHYSRRLSLVPLGKIVPVIQYGVSSAAVDDGAYPMLRMMDLEDDRAIEKDLSRVNLSDDEFERYRLFDEDVLFNRTNSHDLVGRTGVYRLGGDHVFASYLIRLQVDATRLLPDYLSMFLNHAVGRRQILRFATRGVSQSNVNARSLRRMLIPLPSRSYQEETTAAIVSIRTAREQQEARARHASKITASLLNECLGVSP